MTTKTKKAVEATVPEVYYRGEKIGVVVDPETLTREQLLEAIYYHARVLLSMGQAHLTVRFIGGGYGILGSEADYDDDYEVKGLDDGEEGQDEAGAS
jgi:hypothetical protein